MRKVYFEQQLEWKKPLQCSHSETSLTPFAVTSVGTFYKWFFFQMPLDLPPSLPQKHTVWWEDEKGKPLQADLWIQHVSEEEKPLFHFHGVKFNLHTFPTRCSHSMKLTHHAQSTILPPEITPGRACCGHLYTLKTNQKWELTTPVWHLRILTHFLVILSLLSEHYSQQSFIILVWHIGDQIIPLFWKRQWHCMMLDRRAQIF